MHLVDVKFQNELLTVIGHTHTNNNNNCNNNNDNIIIITIYQQPGIAFNHNGLVSYNSEFS